MGDAKAAEDLKLPTAVIGRIIKESLPPNAVVSKEARTALTRAAAVFILNVTTYANEHAEGTRRKTVAASDVYQAVRTMQCDQLEKPLREAVEQWKLSRDAKADEAKKKRAEKKAHDSTVGVQIARDIEDL